VDVEGSAQCPWITWFIDCATRAVTGVAVTPHAPSRDAVVAALRTGISRQEPFGPVGGLPSLVRVDRGKEFLCAAVSQALAGLAVPVHPLPAYTPHLKGTIEQLNDAVEEMLLVSLPGYTRRARMTRAPRPEAGEELLTFAAFVKILLDWVHWWNTEHRPAGLGGALTPLQAWEADPTPVEDVPPGDLAWFALEDDGRTRTITTSGVTWRRRSYIAPWMAPRRPRRGDSRGRSSSWAPGPGRSRPPCRTAVAVGARWPEGPGAGHGGAGTEAPAPDPVADATGEPMADPGPTRSLRDRLNWPYLSSHSPLR
jgi:putative transposase